MVKVNSNGIGLTCAINEHILELTSKLNKHFHMDSSSVSYSAEGNTFSAIIEYRSGNWNVTAKASNHDLYKALTQAAHRVEKQLNVLKNKSL